MPAILAGVTFVSAKKKKPANVRYTSLKMPVMFIEIGPLMVTQSKAVIVIKIPKLPETMI